MKYVASQGREVALKGPCPARGERDAGRDAGDDQRVCSRGDRGTLASGERVPPAAEDPGTPRTPIGLISRPLYTTRITPGGIILITRAEPGSAPEHAYLLYSCSTDTTRSREESSSRPRHVRPCPGVDGLSSAPRAGSHDYLVSEIECGVAAGFVLRPDRTYPPDGVFAVRPVLARASRGSARARPLNLATLFHALRAHKDRVLGEAAGYRFRGRVRAEVTRKAHGGRPGSRSTPRGLALDARGGWPLPYVTAVVLRGTGSETTGGGGGARASPCPRPKIVAVRRFRRLFELADPALRRRSPVVNYEPVLIGPGTAQASFAYFRRMAP